MSSEQSVSNVNKSQASTSHISVPIFVTNIITLLKHMTRGILKLALKAFVIFVEFISFSIWLKSLVLHFHYDILIILALILNLVTLSISCTFGQPLLISLTWMQKCVCMIQSTYGLVWSRFQFLCCYSFCIWWQCLQWFICNGWDIISNSESDLQSLSLWIPLRVWHFQFWFEWNKDF